MGRLRSRHDNSRRDGARTLGRIGDPRAVPALIDLVQMDEDREVRAAAAYALGAIGDPRARTPLEFAARNDRRREVRQAAAQALAQIPAEAVILDAPAAGFAGEDLVPESETTPPPPPDAPYRDDR
jgi:HEAT repeat protein